MSDIDDGSVRLVVTSPPYWQLKDYGVDGQVGFDDSYPEYIDNLNLVWSECMRVLHAGCRLCINIGDQFARSVIYGRYKVIPIHAEVIRFCETIGFDFMGSIIWKKVTTTNTTGGAVIMGSFPFPRNGIVKLDYEHILLFRKLGKAPRPESDIRDSSRLSIDEWNEYFSGHWVFPGERTSSHLAPFPMELPRRLIRMFSFPGETVLDPFMGSGTTAAAALEQGRASFGYELDASLADSLRRRVPGIEVIPARIVGAPSSDDLPYRASEPHALDRIADPRKLTFGSRVAREG